MKSELKITEPDFVVVTGRLGEISSFRSHKAKKGDQYVRRDEALAYADVKARAPLSDRQIQDIAMTDVLLTNFNGYCPTFEDAQRLVRAVERVHGIGTKEGE